MTAAVVKDGEPLPFICPRRAEMGRENSGADYWRQDNTCSYCGSLHPTLFMSRVEDGDTLVPTDKNYKTYIKAAAGGPDQKFYFQHLSPEERIEFVELINQNKIKFAAPGRFYVMPFFIKYK